VARIKALKDAGMVPAAIARVLKVARSSVYRALSGAGLNEAVSGGR
jgi:Helix-turn-helix domain of resolvase